jgi:hypothetical protein
MIRKIFSIRGSPELASSNAHRAEKPQVSTAKTIARMIGLYSSSNGQLMNTLR